MGKIYAIANRKGGCSKTTTCGALASGISRLGSRVLVVDMDPQGNITDWASFDASEADTSYEVIMRRCKAKKAIIKAKHYDLLPADKALANVEAELSATQGREYRLKEALAGVVDDYDYIFIDTPPQLGLLTIISFSAVTGGVIVTTDNGAFATKGMRDLAEVLENTREYFNKDAKVIGILMTRFNARLNAMKVMKDVTKRFGEFFDAPVYNTFIRQSVGVMEAQMESVDIFDTPRINAAMKDYEAFVKEFVLKESLKDKQTLRFHNS